MSNVDTVKRAPSTTGKHRDAVQAFIDAGIKAINEVGIDHVSVSQITKLADSSRPTFYAYFGDISGLLAEIWLRLGPQFLDKLASPSFRFEVSSRPEQAQNRALLEIFTVSHRIPEVQEVLEPTVVKWWSEQAKSKSFAELKLAWLTANRLGTWLTMPIEPRVLSSSMVEMVLSALGDEPAGVPADPRFAKLPSISDPKSPDETVTGQLLTAAIQVIAKSGVASATMVRIARMAQVTTGTVYPRFNNIDDILLKSFDHAITSVTEENFSYTDQTGFAPDQFGAVVMAGLGSGRARWRDYRIETHLEARVNLALANHMRESLSATNARVATGLSALPVGVGEREAIAFLVHTIGIGMAILQNAGIPVGQMDHRVITREMIAVLAKR